LAEEYQKIIISLAIIRKVLRLVAEKKVISMKRIKIKGMNCQHCVMAVTKALGAVDGIKDVNVDLKSSTATYAEMKTVDPAVVAEAIKKAGYEIVE